ncbi:unnamed protein product [Soboliphyme baturini]|uniref:RING-type E3 ubiquitin transferase n=1 Tax=Soboliphyme baturini TaxID=241478 RepID=A0A183ITT8_9BILA|nr:unnamed protein product [Soboliphyme baturini]
MGSRQSVAQPPKQRIAPSVVLDNCESSRSPMSSLDMRQMSQIGNDILNRVFLSSHQQQGTGSSPRSSSFAGPSSTLMNGQVAGHSSSDSSDPDTDLSAGTTVTSSFGMPSLDRLFRLCSTNSSHTDTTVFLPSVAFRCFDMKCPVCHKHIPSDEVECHLVMCLTRPRITYNGKS